MPLQKVLALECVQRGARQRSVTAWREANHRPPPSAMDDVAHIADVMHPRRALCFVVVTGDGGDACRGELGDTLLTFHLQCCGRNGVWGFSLYRVVRERAGRGGHRLVHGGRRQSRAREITPCTGALSDMFVFK